VLLSMLYVDWLLRWRSIVLDPEKANLTGGVNSTGVNWGKLTGKLFRDLTIGAEANTLCAWGEQSWRREAD
jgi:hypothetical protein